jgi:hypothetical protein
VAIITEGNMTAIAIDLTDETEEARDIDVMNGW